MKLYHKNPRQITGKQYGDLEKWLLEFGDLSGIVHDLNSDEIVSGNQRGRVFDINECEIVKVQEFDEPDAQGTVALGYVLWQGNRYGYRAVRWTEEKCEQGNIVANASGGKWDFDILANKFEVDDLLDWGFTEFDFQLAGWDTEEEPQPDPGPQIDKAAELQEKWGTRLGQVWELGDHRLVCGDCTDAAVVESVMRGEKAGAVVTDPPYGINREGITNDDPVGLRALFDGCLAVLPVSDAVVIAFQSPRLEWVWLDAIKASGQKPERLLWMYDENDQTKPWHYWLLCSQAIRVSSTGTPKWADCKAHHDTYAIGLAREFRAGGKDNDFAHASVKPLGVVEDLTMHTVGDVYDPFCGSGTTLIACERLNRRCRAIEIEPKYVAVTLERWATMTNREPVLVEG